MNLKKIIFFFLKVFCNEAAPNFISKEQWQMFDSDINCIQIALKYHFTSANLIAPMGTDFLIDFYCIFISIFIHLNWQQ